ncbi:MAG: dockerin type I domain-containing protein [Candidatus Zixiibacteriota bacterium]
MRGKVLTVLIVIVLSFNSAYAVNAVSISQIQGLDPARGLMTDYAIRYYVHIKVDAATVDVFSNGFRVYSPEDAHWQPLMSMQMVMLSSLFDGNVFFPVGSLDGQGADSLAACGFRIFGPGFQPGFDNNVLYIETKLTGEHIGKTLCLDSSMVGGFEWLWSTDQGGVRPSWDGPHCYDIVDCCAGRRGDVNGDGVGPKIIDLTRLVDYLFRGASAPICKNEADVNSDGVSHNIADLTFIVNYLHRGGPLPSACPSN